MKTLEMTEEQFRAGEEASVGFCLDCGSERYTCEPDADGYTCDECQKPKVQGIDNLLVMGLIDIVEEPTREFGFG